MRRSVLAGLALLAPAAGFAQEEDAVVVTATRVPQPSLEIPASVDRLYADDIREGRPQVDLSESLGRVPGIVVQNRHNYAQDLQISSRGFGARATFGVRGIRLIADGIPATMPDGQGQAATFALGSAERLEVLRGPFSALYGNAAGGVIAVETADGPPVPTVEGSLFVGSHDAWKATLQYGGTWGRLDGLGEISRFETDGFRDHSAARRDQLNAKLNARLSDATALTVVANSLRQPDSQDPGGLDRAAFEDDPTQAGPNAEPFDTRKTVDQDQAGIRLRHRFSRSRSLELTGYAGQRDVLQFLGFPGDFGLSSGGVVDLDRHYYGGALRYFTGERIKVAVGLEYERMEERRKGFVNESGSVGALRRDEDDVVSSTDLFAQVEWPFAERWSAHGGVRHSDVKFEVNDFFIDGVNPDDSGGRDYSATTPVAGIVYRPTKLLSLYGNIGRGFETPTFAELAHSTTGSGPNFALDAARSRHAEAGLKAVWSRRGRVNVALFDIDTRDEIVVDFADDGRTFYKNAGRTERRGVELAAETLLPGPWSAQLAYTRLDATFAERFVSRGETIPSGNWIPGVPRSQAYAQLRYRQPGWYAYLEGLRRSKVAVNDANTEFADAHTVGNLVAGLVQEGAGWRVTEFVRIDNFTDRRYAGSVIVNEGNARFYEPAPGRSYLFGVQARLDL